MNTRDIKENNVITVPLDVSKTELMEDAVRLVEKNSSESLFNEAPHEGKYGVGSSNCSVAIIGLHVLEPVQALLERYGSETEFSIDK